MKMGKNLHPTPHTPHPTPHTLSPRKTFSANPNYLVIFPQQMTRKTSS
ncbi:MAG: hypothetical protein PX481_24560 [Microcystis sp. M53603_WE2]|nr:MULTISPECIES: hypothetical protein [unclassified Microcystis]MCZ8024398.1 hypothetical protein [Microcystis sp. LE19-10.1B]MCZ8361204.1 hypothetical protein [Microcystis sp. LE19-251.1A]MDJ0541791.1 hypothetical protein [Microcystis sp. M53603_WE2]MDJ0603660.1 hypothetical protein [Microcystis sp. M53602_WE12]